jgi:hypothetical protein
MPSGLSESEYETVFAERMGPFLAALHRRAEIPCALYYSGPLIHWVERRHPEFFALLKAMIARQQVELLTGGFFEPHFPLIPIKEKSGQIELMSTYLRRQFGIRPTGAFIPYSSFESTLVSVLPNSHINYVFFPQAEWRNAGAEGEWSPCLIEHEGSCLCAIPYIKLAAGKQLPNSKQLRWRWPRETVINEAFEDDSKFVGKPCDQLHFDHDSGDDLKFVGHIATLQGRELRITFDEAATCNIVHGRDLRIPENFRNCNLQVRD